VYIARKVAVEDNFPGKILEEGNVISELILKNTRFVSE
jgi:hypothetical protein